MAEIWQNFLSIVREEVGSRVVETWFKAVVLVRWDSQSKTVYLQAPNQFVKEWITNNYMELFQQHLGRLLSEKSIKVVFIASAQARSPRESIIERTIHTHQPAVQQSSLEKLASNEDVGSKKEIVYTPAKSIVPVMRRGNGSYGSLDESYRFDTFIVGPSNSLACAAARAVAENPGRLYNPFFIYGGSGLGKTHLLHAIGQKIKEDNKKTQIVYQTADRFVHEFINAIRFDKMHNFETKYKDVDVLLVDDIQFISHKEQTQEAFFHIFNMLHRDQKQIVFTSDSLPRDIEGLAARMRSRLEWGLVADVSVPTLEMKVAILKKKAESHNEILSDEIAYAIASRVVSNIRELEGALMRVVAYTSLTGTALTVDMLDKIIAPAPPAQQQISVDLKKVATIVGRYFNYSLQELRSSRRDKDVAIARHVALYLMKKLTNRSLREIGTFLHRKDHSTVIHACEKIEEERRADTRFSQIVEQLEREISLQ